MPCVRYSLLDLVPVSSRDVILGTGNTWIVEGQALMLSLSLITNVWVKVPIYDEREELYNEREEKGAFPG